MTPKYLQFPKHHRSSTKYDTFTEIAVEVNKRWVCVFPPKMSISFVYHWIYLAFSSLKCVKYAFCVPCLSFTVSLEENSVRLLLNIFIQCLQIRDQDFLRPLTQVEHPLCSNQIQLFFKIINNSCETQKSMRLNFAVTTYWKISAFAKST